MKPFMPTGPVPAKIMIIGEAPGAQEEQEGAPFVGSSGQELSRMLQDAGIIRSTCFITNVVRVRPPRNDIGHFIALKKKDITNNHVLIWDKFVLPCVRDGLAQLKQEIEMCRPNVIIACGNTALWALTGKWGITSWRGSLMECGLSLSLDYQPKVIPTYHPAMVLRQWSWRQVGVMDFKKAKRQSTTPTLTRRDYDFIIRPNFETTLNVLAQLYKQAETQVGKLGVDIETRAGHIACLGIAWSDTEAICIPFMCTESAEGYWPVVEEARIIYALYQLLTHPNVEVIGQGYWYDQQYIHKWWHFLTNLTRDTMVTQHSMFANMPKSLAFICSMYLEDYEFWKDEGKEWDAKVPEEQLWRYNCKDSCNTFAVDTVMQGIVKQMGLEDVESFQQALVHPVLNSMLKGIRYDTSKQGMLAMQLQDEIAVREDWLTRILGHPINIRSPKQMATLFYTDLGQAPVRNRKTGSVSCDDEALSKVASREPILIPIIKKIQELRSLGVFLSTFIKAPTDPDGRMRCTYNICGTETYRFSSRKNAFGRGLNLQNIPKGDEDGEDVQLPNVKSLFIPDPGKTFFDIDLDSADLRIVVAESGEADMQQMLDEGHKVYVEVMKEFYNDPTLTKASKQYRTFKGLCHGTHYLGTSKGIAQNLGLGIHEVDKIQKWYFQRFPKIKLWQNDFKDQVIKRRYVENIFGYRCYIWERIAGNVFNEAIAWVPQSTVACIINRGYVALCRDYPEIDVLLQVHDSLAGQFPTHLGDWAKSKIAKSCEVELPYETKTIIPVDVHTSLESWGGCE